MLLLQENLPKKRKKSVCSLKKTIRILATNSYTFIPHIASQYIMVGFFSFPQGDEYTSQDKRSWFIIYESLYKT